MGYIFHPRPRAADSNAAEPNGPGPPHERFDLFLPACDVAFVPHAFPSSSFDGLQWKNNRRDRTWFRNPCMAGECAGMSCRAGKVDWGKKVIEPVPHRIPENQASELEHCEG